MKYFFYKMKTICSKCNKNTDNIIIKMEKKNKKKIYVKTIETDIDIKLFLNNLPDMDFNITDDTQGILFEFDGNKVDIFIQDIEYSNVYNLCQNCAKKKNNKIDYYSVCNELYFVKIGGHFAKVKKKLIFTIPN